MTSTGPNPDPQYTTHTECGNCQHLRAALEKIRQLDVTELRLMRVPDWYAPRIESRSKGWSLTTPAGRWMLNAEHIIQVALTEEASHG